MGTYRQLEDVPIATRTCFFKEWHHSDVLGNTVWTKIWLWCELGGLGGTSENDMHAGWCSVSLQVTSASRRREFNVWSEWSRTLKHAHMITKKKNAILPLSSLSRILWNGTPYSYHPCSTSRYGLKPYVFPCSSRDVAKYACASLEWASKTAEVQCCKCFIFKLIWFIS